MVARSIVRDPETFSGRWHFADTTIFIDELHRDYQRSGEAIRLPYQTLGLSHEEVDAGLAFEYPEVTDPLVELQFTVLTIQCVCGEVRQAGGGPEFKLDPCLCGRTWQIPVEPVTPILVGYRPPADLIGSA